MPSLPSDYDDCFLGNGIDGVYVGYTGAMVPERLGGPEGCSWYKADRYYPRHLGPPPVPHRHYRKEVAIEPDPRDTWFELAPLARVWFDVLDESGHAMAITNTSQQLDVATATLTSDIAYAGCRARVSTWIHATRPLLFIRLDLDGPRRVRVSLGHGPWVVSDDEPEPFDAVELCPGPRPRFVADTTRGALTVDPTPVAWGTTDRELWVEVAASELMIVASLVDDPEIDPLVIEDLDSAPRISVRGALDRLRTEHIQVWSERRGRSNVVVPDGDIQRVYDRGLQLFRSIQSPKSGAIPVGIGRQTWSSHVFWDASFPARALVEANHVEAARAHCRFLERTSSAAREHARTTFGVDGLAWDWELTHSGERAYGRDWVHLAHQVHNTAACSNLLFDTWRATRDDSDLAVARPLLEGIARFFEAAVVERREATWGTRPLVGVHESAIRVRDDLFNLAGAMRVFINAVAAECGSTADRARWRAIARGLRPTLHSLFDGRTFRAHASAASPTLSCLAPMWPMEVVATHDPRAVATADAFMSDPSFRAPGGWPRRVWEAAVLARVLIAGGRADAGLAVLRDCLAGANQYGGLAERLDDEGRWNLQYFSTGHAAYVSAIHAMLVTRRRGALEFFPSVPSAWRALRFERIRIGGFLLSGELADGVIASAEIQNDAGVAREVHLRVGGGVVLREIGPGESIRIR
jgi:hypothetical protein